MIQLLKYFFNLFLFILFIVNSLTAEELDYHPSQWHKKVFKGETSYIYNSNEKVITAQSQGQASSIALQGPWKLNKDSRVRWQWRVNKFPKVDSEKTKQDDDFAARVYLIYKGFLPWQIYAINYVWSQKNNVNDHWSNPFTNNAHMVVLTKQSQSSSEFIQVEVQPKEDFQKYFSLDISELSGIAIMTDSDNTNTSSEAEYKNFEFIK